ncbi:GSCFA domain-containing protein [Hymenobacter sp. BT635]|uniref:GSCFA domain-containing protein n=1 Tax=Hymenobacter nitidus TaxID=2880929 RepID=A0ABS8ACT0_9BACT|nr:GSCFA domain-containing protein [Hymenobacter nitidus]MCB2378198.1 GSCFA domain-containing protein [Hymenobacter nitidus]
MFRTELPLTPHPQQLPLSTRVLTVGSCFSDTIGSRLAAAKVHTLVNPFGTVFNPLSACQLLRAAAGEEMDWQQHLVEARGRWQSYDLHATIGADSPVTLLQRIQGLVQEVGAFLQQTDVVILTLGTAYAYRLLETDEVVNNCHKVPADRFEKVLLTPDEIINAVAETHAYLRRANPKLRFILTVSPVRHLKDTLPLNSVSKSVLRVACHYLSELLPDVSYFPAYELLVDDLRDYRFYAADMLHPSETAETYIWERFTRTYFDAAFGRFRKEWESVRQALGHRPLYQEAPEHREFLEATLGRLHRLASQANVQAEIREVERQLAALPVPQPTIVPEPEPDDDEERIDIGEPQSQPREVKGRPAFVPAVTAPVSPLPTPEPEVQAEDDSDAEDTDEADEADQQGETPAFPKKKRRSRGGAKRTARKKAAQLYAQQLAEASGSVSTAESVEPAPADDIVAPSSQPEDQSAPAHPAEALPTAEPAAAETAVLAEPVAAAAPVVVPAPVRVSAPAPARVAKPDWLQLMDESEEIVAPAPSEANTPARIKKASQAAEKKPRAVKDRLITTPPRNSRRKQTPLYAEPAPETDDALPVEAVVPVEAPVEALPAAPIESAAPAPEVVAAVVAPIEAIAPEPVAEKPEPKKKSRPKAAPKAKATPKAKAPAAAPEVVPAAAPEVAPEPAAAKVPPKKRTRPPRKKPAAADETPPAS